MTNTLGRLYTVHPKQRECFFLRLLLVNVPGPTSFQYLRKVNGTLYDTFFDACRELHLLVDDNHWDLTLADAALSSSPQQIRQLFSIILTVHIHHCFRLSWKVEFQPKHASAFGAARAFGKPRPMPGVKIHSVRRGIEVKYHGEER